MEARVEEEQRCASEYREQYGIAERRSNALNGELEESRTLLEQSDRARRQAESDLSEATETLNELSASTNGMSLAKRKLEGELQTLHVRIYFFVLKFCYDSFSHYNVNIIICILFQNQKYTC